MNLEFGEYYAISFLGFGSHVGAGSISLREDVGSLITLPVTFPDPASASAVFANFLLPSGNTVTVESAGVSADRIQIVANGGGLTGDGTPDAFYRFVYAPIPEPGSYTVLAGVAALLFSLTRRRGLRAVTPSQT